MSQDQVIIDSLMAEAETAVTEATQPSLSEAYTEGRNVGLTETPRRREESRNTTLAEEEASARELAGIEKNDREKITVRRSPTLAEAHDGTEIEEQTIELDAIPASLRGRFSADAISAAMNVLGLNENDLQDERWTVILEQRLEEEAAAANPEEDDEPNPETEESEEEKKDDEQKPEVKDEAKKAPVHVDLAPEDVKKYVDRTWERSQQVNSPQMTKLFTDSLATALGTPPEQRELLDNVVGLLNYGGVSLVQSALPAMVDEYMQENFGPNIMRVFSHVLEAHLPGVTASFHTDQATKTWDAVRAENDSFASLPDFESKEFVELRDKIRAANPWIDSWDPDPKMPPLQALKAKAQLFARLALGERVDPKRAAAQIADALQLGKKSAERSSRRITGSAMRGSNGRRGSGTIGQNEERAGLMDAWNAKHGKGTEGI
jgi:hypothetical protein